MSELVVSDRYVPDAYEGKLEPNYYCRSWNEKRAKYCRARAGKGTEHKGTGRCKQHGGNSAVVHGRYSALHQERLAPLLERLRAEPLEEKLSTFPELDLARALLADWIDRFEEFAEALVAWHESFIDEENPPKNPKPRKILDITTLVPLLDTISKLIHRMHQAQSINSIPRRRFLDLMTEIGRAMNEEVSNPADLRRLKARIAELRL